MAGPCFSKFNERLRDVFVISISTWRTENSH